MKEFGNTRGSVLLTAIALGATATVLTLGQFVRSEIRRRGYPSWDECHCEFKQSDTIFQVWYSHHQRQGETIVAHEWGVYLVHPAPWLRRILHHSSQILAALNSSGRYLQRITLSPQEAYQFAGLLRALSGDEQLPSNAQIVWRREVLHYANYPFGVCIRRLYPAHIAGERAAAAQSIPALWDPQRDLPLSTEGPLLDTPNSTRVDFIGWTPSQISYCTARLSTSK
jgi:hypothetical protein